MPSLDYKLASWLLAFGAIALLVASTRESNPLGRLYYFVFCMIVALISLALMIMGVR